MRRFDRTPEPRGSTRRRATPKALAYAIQKHAARRLHYDLRLELDGVLKSWAVTRGPSLDPADKRLAIRTEDHPLEYGTFEGVIPAGYGAGTVLLWDRGTWKPVGDPHDGLARGKLAFRLDGERLRGRWALVRFKGKGRERQETWLLIKELDEHVRRGGDPLARHRASVASGRDLDAIAAAAAATPVDRKTARGNAARDETAADASAATGIRARPRGRRRRPPAFVAPQLATLVDRPPTGPDWLFEVKLDGYRLLAAVAGAHVRLFTRSGLDWTDRFPGVAAALAARDLPAALLDGEAIALDRAGKTDFGLLQRSFDDPSVRVRYAAFDLLAEDGADLRRRPLAERKDRLRALIEDGADDTVLFADHVEGHGARLMEAVCAKGFEGIMAKRATAAYRSGRGCDWLKVKCGRGQEFVIVGWTPSERGRPFASVLLATHAQGGLRYAGRVGTGFDAATLDDLARRFRRLAAASPAVDGVPADIGRTARWLRPVLVAEIDYAEMTADGRVRHGRFKGLRADKPARQVVSERPVARATAGAGAERAEDDAMARNEGGVIVAGVRLTHPERVLFPTQGITKRDLATYLEAAAARMRVHLDRRLVSLVRCPEGRAKQCFFQRHAGAGLGRTFKRLAVAGKDGGSAEYLYLDSTEGLVATAQIGALELHVWGSRIDDIERPDRVVFDLDPDEGLPFARVVDGAGALRAALEAAGLASFALLTGGKGVHVVVPIRRRHGWPVVAAFAAALAARIAAAAPDRYVATMSKAKRKGRVFIDHFRNGRGATAIAPYSTRARERAPVAWPVGWGELARIPGADAVTMGDALRRLDRRDPWAGYATTRQELRKPVLDALGVETG